MKYIRKITVKNFITEVSKNKNYVTKDMSVDDFRKAINGENNHLSVYGIDGDISDFKDDIAITLVQMQNKIQKIEYVVINEACLNKLKLEKPEKDILTSKPFISNSVVHYNFIKLKMKNVIKLFEMFTNNKYCFYCEIDKNEIINAIINNENNIRFELFNPQLLNDIKRKVKETSAEQKCIDAIQIQREQSNKLFKYNNPSLFNAKVN